jgi:hypothetical protein
MIHPDGNMSDPLNSCLENYSLQVVQKAQGHESWKKYIELL